MKNITKKILIILLSFTLVICNFGCINCSFATETKVTEEGIEYYINGSTAIVAGYNGENQNLVLPDTIEGYRIYIESSAFKDNTTLRSVVLPDYIKYIQMLTFANCVNLESITMPQSLIFIGPCAFEGCTNLKSVDIPESVTKIDGYAFNGCTSLESVVLPDKLETLDYSAFQYCTNLKMIKLPENLTEIKHNMFEGCTSLKSITIPDSVKTMGSSIFKKCTNLESIVIPEGVQTLDYSTFEGCTNLKEVTLPDSLKNINSDAFNGCINLENLKLPNGLISIGLHTFRNCKNLNNLEIPNSVITIGGFAFCYCEKFDTFVMPDSVVNLGDGAFYECINLKNITLSKNITKIGYETFEGCSSLESIKIPKGVTNIRFDAFKGCSKLSNVILPDGLTSIESNIFTNCVSLKNIDLPDSIENIGSGAFLNTALESITIPKNVTNLSHYLFSGCKDLKKIVIPLSVTSVEMNTFENIDNFTIYGYRGSYISSYARQNNIEFKPIDSIDSDIFKIVYEKEFQYTGSKIEPIVEIFYDDIELTEGVDYKISYSNNIDQGTGIITITGISPITGSVNKEFSIIKIDNKVNNLRATTTTSSVSLNWDKASGCQGYEVYRYNTSTKSYKLIQFIKGSDQTSYTDESRNSGTIYKYKVRAWRDQEEDTYYTNFSNTVKAVTLPNTPTLSLTNNTISSISLQWDKISRASGYEVYRYNTSTKSYSLIKTISDGSTTTYTNTNRTSATTYKYKIRAYRMVDGVKIYSDYSDVLSVTTKPLTPVVTVKSTLKGQAKLTWTNCSSRATEYEVYMSKSKSGTYSLIGTTPNKYFDKSGLISGKYYYFKVRAYRTVSGKNIYSSYSTVKSVKVK